MTSLLLAFLISLPIQLEWNQSWSVETPYEVEVDLNKLGLSGVDLQAFADGKKLQTTELIDTASAGSRYRFSVPRGARSLTLERGINTKVSSLEIDNLFKISSWTSEDGARVSPVDGGYLIESTKWKTAEAKNRVELPEGMAGKHVVLELDCRSLTPMTWPVRIWMAQYDKDGKLLPENVYDGRWTTHFRPYDKLTAFRETGWIHPEARSIELIFRMRTTLPKYDSYGLPLADPEEARPRLLVSRISLRPASIIPFPGYNDTFFSDGVSGKPYDRSFAFDGSRGFFFCTRSIAAWAGGVQLRKEEQLFYPSAGGTVEVWLKPRWSSSTKEVHFFEAGHYNPVPSKKKRTMMGLTYNPGSRNLTLSMQDVDRNKFTKSVKCNIPSGNWTHCAVTFEPGGNAVVYVNGHQVLTLALDNFKPVDLQHSKTPNDDGPTQFFLGGSLQTVRETYHPMEHKLLYPGDADLLRISSTIRYSKDFSPSKTYSVDKDTRAFFDFNRSFDGKSGTGSVYIPGSLQSSVDKYSHTVNGQNYYPEKNADDNNPAKLLFPRVTKIPSDNDFSASDIVRNVTFSLKPGEKKSLEVEGQIHTDCIEIYNPGNDILKYPVVLNDGDIDTRSYGDIAASLNVPGAKDKDKVNRFFNYLLEVTDYFMTHQATFAPGTDVPSNVEYEALDVLNSYCGFECGPLNHAATMLFSASAGCASNWTAGYGHSFEEVFYDGRNHIYDLSAQSFFPAMDNETAAGLRESDEQEYIQHRAGTGSGMHFTRGTTRQFDTRPSVYPEKFAISLNPGERVRYWSVNEGQTNDLVTRGPSYMIDYSEKTGAKVKSRDDNPKGGIYRVDRFFPEYGNGIISFEGRPQRSNPAFVNIEDGSFCYSVNAFYPVVCASYQAVDDSGKVCSLDISTDGGRTFRPFSSPATYIVRARKSYLIRVNAPLEKVRHFSASTEFIVNSRALSGILKTGVNNLEFKAEGGSSAEITYTYRTRGKSISFSNTVNYGAIVGCERRLVLLDPQKGPLSLSVNGIDGKPELACGPGIEARIAGKARVVISATDSNPHFSWLTIKDGERRQTISILICEGARLASVGSRMSSKGETCSASFERIPKGRYQVFTMQRLPVDVSDRWTGRASLTLGSAPSAAICAPVNRNLDYYKDIMGPDGGRGVWRWDTPMDPKYKYPYSLIRIFETDQTDHIDFKYTGKGDLLELDSVLIVPEPSEDFKCELIKNLFGRNMLPWIIEK